MLCLYKTKTDFKPQYFLSMGDDQCVGCKRDFNSDRNHSVRVMLADGTYWSIALATETEANDWIQSLCQAISEGLKVDALQLSCCTCAFIKKLFFIPRHTIVAGYRVVRYYDITLAVCPSFPQSVCHKVCRSVLPYFCFRMII